MPLIRVRLGVHFRPLWLRAGLMVIGSLVGVGLFSAPACADWLYTHVGLTCDVPGNRAMVRIANAWNSDAPSFTKFPESVDGGLSKLPVLGEHSCKLADGREVRVRQGQDPAPEFGPGGAIPPIWISLWVDKRKILSRELIDGNGCRPCLVVAIIVDGHDLKRCEIPPPKDPRDIYPYSSPEFTETNVTCRSIGGSALTGIPDTVEYPPRGAVPRPPAGSIQILKGSKNRLCGMLVSHNSGKHGYPHVFYDPDPGHELPGGTQDGITLEKLGGPVNAFDDIGNFKWPAVKGSTFDFANEGDDQRVVLVRARDPVFDGEFFIVTKTQVPDSQILELFAPHVDAGLKTVMATATAKGWRIYSGENTPYHSNDTTHFDVLDDGNATYLLAYPASRFQNRDPTAVLLKPTADGQLKTVCVYQRVRQNS